MIARSKTYMLSLVVSRGLCICFVLHSRMSGDRKKLTIAEVNALAHDEFIAIFGNVVEHCALCSAVAWGERPFRNYQEMQTKFDNFIDQLSISGM